MKNYTAYHLHSDRSLLDSCTQYKDYIDLAVSYGMSAIGFSEHGNIYNWIEKKMYCDENNIKYLHCCEIYLTESLDEKIRDNYHTILIAKNQNGVKELNLLIDLSTQESHMYYKNRLSFDEFLDISNNIIKISACLASPLNKLSEDNPYYDKLLKKYDYYEIQYHQGDQCDYNKKLYKLSKQYDKPLIVGTDTHSLNKYKAECRSILKKAKRMLYDNEDLFDLTFKSYNELVDKFTEQNSLPIDVILEAIENTNNLANQCEDIILDTTVKYPTLSEDDESLFVKRIYEKCKEKLDKGIITKNEKYLNQINEEIRVFKKLNMCSFMLFMSELCIWCSENGIPTGFCRGSVGGSCIAYILDIIDVNPIQWNTIFSRFANEDREEVGDIDLDFSPSQRELVYNYIINRFGFDKSAYILAIGTISDKGTIDDIGRALSIMWLDNDDKYNKFRDDLYNKIDKLKSEGNGYGLWETEGFGYERLKELAQRDENPYSLKNIAKIKEEYDKDSEVTKSKYPDLFYYFDGLLGTAISQSIHPAGIIASPVTLHDNYGTFWSKGKRIMQINMEEVHDGAGLVKYDILGLKNIEIIKDTYELLGMKYPKSHEINWNDEEVWKHITDSPVGIFQFEGNYAYDLLKRYQPRQINDLSLVNASLRPSGASYRDRLIAREFNHNPSEILDELLKDNKGWLVFQEDSLKFLIQICGMSGSEADNVRRAIGRKQEDRLKEALPKILEGYCNKSDKPRDIAEEEAKEFLQILSDSSNYQFGYNHSTGYSMIGYLCGYLRYYYPLEFTTSYLNNANNEDDIKSGTQLANQLDIQIKTPKFRHSNGRYMPSKEDNSIYKGIGSIKFLNEQVGNDLYSLRNNQYNNFLELLLDILGDKTTIDMRQLDILIKIGFFSEFGGSKYLLDIVDMFNNIYSKKQFKKDNIPTPLTIELLKKYSDKETEKLFKEVRVAEMFSELISTMDNTKDISLLEIFKTEIEFVGYISYINTSYNPNVAVVTDMKLNKFGTPFATLYWIYDGSSETIKIDKRYYNEKPISQFEVITTNTIDERHKKRKIDGKWENLEETEKILCSYGRVIFE
jgi:DNA polymerase III subunit alpha